MQNVIKIGDPVIGILDGKSATEILWAVAVTSTQFKTAVIETAIGDSCGDLETLLFELALE